jgi:c-di-GMP-binding flagellar brake protein YcgR
MSIFFVLGAFVLVLLAIVLTLAMRGEKRYSWLEFYIKTHEAGLSMAEARILREAASAAGVADTTNILWSPRDLDRSIVVLLSRLRDEGRDRTREGIALMDKVYTFRKKLEFELPRYKYGIRSSRNIATGQRVRILVHGVGVMNSTIIDNHARYLVLSSPTGNRLPKDWVWKGKKVSVYFWRREDAGYVFDSYVMDDLSIRNVPVIQVSHSESLLRTQKRKSVRARSRIPAYMYLLKRIEGAYEKAERAPGLKSVIQDISEDGVSVAIGGRAVPGLQIKVQFTLQERNIVMSGVVRSVDYDSEKNRSVLHVEAVTPSPRTRNAIRSYVYNVRAEERASAEDGVEAEGAGETEEGARDLRRGKG